MREHSDIPGSREARACKPGNDRIFRYLLTICFLVYIISAKGYVEVLDTSFSVATAQAIVTHRSLDLPPAPDATMKGIDGKSYSKYGIGLALCYLPWIALSDALARPTGLPTQKLIGFLISFVNIPFAILTVFLFARLLRDFGLSDAYIWALSLALGLGTLAWKYATYDYSEEIQMCLLLLAYFGVVHNTRRALIIGAWGFACLTLVKLVFVAFAPLFLIYLLSGRGDLRAGLKNCALFSFPFLLAVSILAGLNQARFGSPWESGYGSEAHQFFPIQLGQTIPRLLGSLDKGLLVCCPILLLAALGWKEFASRRRREAVLCASLITGNLILSGAWYGWEGGWSWGPRLLVPTVPLWLLPAALWLPNRVLRRGYGCLSWLQLFQLWSKFPGSWFQIRKFTILNSLN